MTGQVRCNACRTWFDRRNSGCPECGRERPAWNKWLRTAGLNKHLFAQAEASSPAAEYERSYRRYRREIRQAVDEL